MSQTLPTEPAQDQDHQQVIDEWAAAIDQLYKQIEAWSAKQPHWGTLRDPKEVEERPLGTYTVPRLLVHSIKGRVVFDPVARYVGGGATGLIDVSAIPSFGYTMLIREDTGWVFQFDQKDKPLLSLSEESFLDTYHWLVANA